MLGCLVAIARLVEQASAGADDAVAADDPVAARDAGGLGRRKLGGNFDGIGESRLDRVLVNVRLHGAIGYTGSVEHLPPDRAGRGKDEAQSNNLVEKQLYEASPTLGRGSTGDLRSAAQRLFRDSSTGTESIPRL